jgi:tellurite resistance protein TerA
MSDGRKGVVQALGNQFGSLDAPPYVLLDGDDRSGASSERREPLRRPGARPRAAPRARLRLHLRGRVRLRPGQRRRDLTPATGAPIEVRLDETAGRSRMCAVALLDNTGGELVVRREVRYVDGAQDALDRAYGWGMDWTPGRK